MDDVKQPDPTQSNEINTTPASVGSGEVKLRERRRRESAPVIGVPELDHPSISQSQVVRGARRVSKGSQRALLTSCLSEDSTIEGLEHSLDVNTPKGSRRNFIELMMNCSPQVSLKSDMHFSLNEKILSVTI